MWSKQLVEWTENNTAYLSVVFTWDLPKAHMRAVWLTQEGYHVIAGGPAVKLMPDYLSEVAEIGDDMDGVLEKHNPDATFTSRGCIRKCKFCAVPVIEGDLVELDDWELKPIVCDNNLLACSIEHFNKVVDRLNPLKDIDFNQGLDARLLTQYHADRIAELNMAVVRLAWDDMKSGNAFMQAFERLRKAGIKAEKIRVYCLINFKDMPDDALFRIRTVNNIGALPSPMRYQPLDTLTRNAYISPNWTSKQITRCTHFWLRQLHGYRGIIWEDFRY